MGPYHQPDPQYHWDGIMDSLRRAAEHLPRVDAIGGSAAGVYVDNQVKFVVAVPRRPPELFEKRVRDIFRDLKRDWNGVPFDVVNDGDVTALLGSMSLRGGGVLGIALGTSTAGGYVTAGGHITPWLNEIAFVPIDYRPDAPRDEWSGDIGCCVQYLSQQALARLLPAAQIDVAPATPLPARLRYLQALMQAGDPRAADVYQTLGVYLGYAIAHLASVYDFQSVLVLGRGDDRAGRRGHARDRARGAARRLSRARSARLAAHARREGEAPRSGHRGREPARRPSQHRELTAAHGFQVVPAGLVGEGKSTNAQLQSTTFAGSTACVGIPVTVTRLSADCKIGRLTACNVMSASVEMRLIAVGSSATTLSSEITSGCSGLV